MNRPAFFVLTFLLATLPTQAAITVQLYQNSYSYNVGGEFRAVATGYDFNSNYDARALTGTGSGKGFETFCMEYNEEFYPGSGHTYVAEINSGAVNGGVDHGATGSAHFDPLSIGTAWLYSQFAAGQLDGYDYANLDGKRNLSANSLQQAIWYLENEIPNPQNPSFPTIANNPFYKQVVDKNFLGGPQADANGAFGVVALNLYYQNPDGSKGGVAQDQLALVAVPEASTIVAGGLVLIPLFSKLRKPREKSV
jgi:hypothetical protein